MPPAPPPPPPGRLLALPFICSRSLLEPQKWLINFSALSFLPPPLPSTARSLARPLFVSLLLLSRLPAARYLRLDLFQFAGALSASLIAAPSRHCRLLLLRSPIGRLSNPSLSPSLHPSPWLLCPSFLALLCLLCALTGLFLSLIAGGRPDPRLRKASDIFPTGDPAARRAFREGRLGGGGGLKKMDRRPF